MAENIGAKNTHIFLISIGISNIRRRQSYTLLITVIIVNLLGLINYYTDPYTQREQWRQAVSFVENSSTEKAAALFVFPDPFAPYLWYSTEKESGYGIAPEFIFKHEDIKNMTEIIYERDRMFLFQYLTGLTDPQNLVSKNLEASNYSLTATNDFPGVGFIYTYDKR